MLATTATWSLVTTLPAPMYNAAATCSDMTGHIGALKDIEFEYNVAMASKMPEGQGTVRVLRQPCDRSLYTAIPPWFPATQARPDEVGSALKSIGYELPAEMVQDKFYHETLKMPTVLMQPASTLLI